MSTTTRTDLRRIALGEKIPEGYTLYDSIYVTFLKWKVTEQEWMSCCRG